MSKLVIGGVSLSRLSDREIRALFESADALGVHEIDTAPSYGSSEERIGKNLTSSKFKINSKIFTPGSDSISKSEVRRSIENSLRLLKVESLHTLFLHSIREPIYGADIHNELLKLKSEGKISQVGYSGDGNNLKAITSKFRFDAFQATLNVLDLGNLDFIKSNRSMESYIKRPLCNQIFQIKPRLDVIDFFSRLTRFESKDPQSYHARFNTLFGNRLLARVNVVRVFSFLLSLKLDSKIIVGVSSVEHLVHLSNLTSEFPNWDEIEIIKHIENWSKKANQGMWETLT